MIEIPDAVRDRIGRVEVDGNIIQDTKRFTTERVSKQSSKEDQLKKKKKVRTCALVGSCSFKNVWTHPDRCYASFSVWHTCLHRGTERKL